MTTGTLDNTGNVWSNPDEWKDGNADSSNITSSTSARGDWFDVTLASSISNFNDLEIFMQLDSSSGTTTNIYEIELFFSDGTSYLKTYAANSDAPNQANAGFNSYQWQDFGDLSVNSAESVDSLIDTPMNLEASSGNNPGNYATFNPLDAWSSMSFANGNLEMSDNANGGDKGGFLTLGPTSGKFYWEVTFTTLTSDGYVGLAKRGRTQSSSDMYSGAVDAYVYYKANGNKIGQNNANGGVSYGATWGANDVMGVAVDWDAGSIIFYKNGTSQGTAWTGEDLSEYMPAVYFNTNGSGTAVLNTGQRPFAYTPPTGYKSLCTTNLADPTIADGSNYFDVALWTGTGSSQTVSLGFDADLIWTKTRSHAVDHKLVDSVRGLTKIQESNQTRVDYTDSNGITATSATGFTVGTSGDFNTSGRSYCAWAWDGGDLVTNSAYNQSQTWSTYGSASGTTWNPAVSNLFNNDLSSGPSLLANNTGTWTFTSGITASNSIEIYCVNGSGPSGTQTSGTEIRLTVDGTVHAINGSPGWINTGLTGSLTAVTIHVTSGSGSSGLRAIKVDGKELVDAGLIPPGSLNSSLYNQSAAWNSQVTGTSQSYNFGGGGLRGDNNWFDGDIKHASSALSGNTIEWVGSIAFTSSFAIASDNDGVANAVNITHGPSNTVTNVRSQLPNTANSQLAAGTIPLTTLTGITSPVTKISCVGGSSGANGLTQVVVDGKMLVDSGITLANVPTIASTVRANPSAGFSIVSWTGNGTNGATVGHGLSGAENGMIIVKNRDFAGVWWATYHASLTTGKVLALNTTNAEFDETYLSRGIIELVTSSTFTCTSGTAGNETANGNGNSHIAYCFAPVEGYSAFGSYTGNGSTDGPFVYTGFRPKLVLVKDITGSNHWGIIDTERDVNNAAGSWLLPNDSSAEINFTSSNPNDILSNGFKIRNNGGLTNTSGSTYIYAAFAENPFKTSRAR